MKPTIEELRDWLVELAEGGSALRANALLAALDVAEAAALDDIPHRAVREAEEKFRATIAPEGT